MNRIIYILLFFLSKNIFCLAQTNEIQPQGNFKTIELSDQKKAIDILNSNDKSEKEAVITRIIKSPNSYNPPVIYALSRALFSEGKKDSASYWFYIAQLRARYDANLCLDNTAKQAVAILNAEYGPEINNYAFQDMTKLEKIVTNVVEFVRKNDEDYDHRWINLHGMDAVGSGLSKSAEVKELSEPKEQWPAIKKKTVDDYYAGFIEYAKSRK